MHYSELKNYQNWIIDLTVDHDLLRQIQTMSDEDLFDAFSRSLEFGTAGIRGIMGPGSNRLNIYTIRKTALAFGKYLLHYHPQAQEKGIVIAYDNRFMSRQFCDETATIMTGLGIKTYLFDDLRPTPELSFAVRYLGCVGGVVITASHNPKQYNGFKVYDEQGCQLTPDLINKIYPYYYEITNELSICIQKRDQLMVKLGADIDQAYYKSILEITLQEKLPHEKVKVVYSAQHGTGYAGVKYLLEYMKYQVVYVHEQCVPDPSFSKTVTPNPEDKRAYNRAIEIAKATDAHLILTTDPDADRIGVVECIQGNPIFFTGNQIGALLIDYIISHKKIKKPGLFYDTIVSSRLAGKIAKQHGLSVVSTLTGFKFIGQKIAELPDSDMFVFGYEESYGYLLAPFARDKDALQAALMIMEMKTHYYAQGKTLSERLEELYRHYGYHLEEVVSLQFEGPNSQEKLSKLVHSMRSKSISMIGEWKVRYKEDYLTGKKYYPSGYQRNLTLPVSDVLRYQLENGSEIALRPSGTEPKCKLYFNLVAPNKEAARVQFSILKESVEAILQQ